jgi:DNA-binding transcriptional regulator LsrR (DeoR family)
MVRIGEMENEESRKIVAQMYVEGADRQQIADIFNVHKDTITDWTARPDVQAIISALRRERANRITRKIDTIIEQRLEKASDMDTETLLKIRKDFGGSDVDEGGKGSVGEAIGELMAAAAKNPELAALLVGNTQLPPAAEDEPEESIVDAVVVGEDDE